MPLLPCLISGLCRNSGNVEGASYIEEFVHPLVDNRSGEAAVDPEREGLLDRQHLDGVILAVGHQLVREHGGHGVVPEVVGYPQPPSKQLDGQVLRFTRVEEDAVLLLGGEADGHVGARPHIKRLHLDIGGVV